MFLLRPPPLFLFNGSISRKCFFLSPFLLLVFFFSLPFSRLNLPKFHASFFFFNIPIIYHHKLHASSFFQWILLVSCSSFPPPVLSFNLLSLISFLFHTSPLLFLSFTILSFPLLKLPTFILLLSFSRPKFPCSKLLPSSFPTPFAPSLTSSSQLLFAGFLMDGGKNATLLNRIYLERARILRDGVG